jgi:hypothetical protein
VSDPRERLLRGGRGAPEGSAAQPESEPQRVGAPAHPDELREIREVVSLVRGLPDPEPPEGLVQRVMERVAEIEPRPWYGTWGREIAPVVGSALAAGVAGLLFFAALQPSPLEPFAASGREEVASRAQIHGTATAAGGPSMRTRRPSVTSLPHAAVAGPHTVFFAGEMPGPVVPGAAEGHAMQANAIDRGLDRQLNLMLLNPEAFFQRLESVLDRERFLARLASRAALRGDATQVALRLRTSPHQLARPASDQFLRASLVEYGPGRRGD